MRTARLATAVFLCVPVLAPAQPEPANPGALAPSLRYQSAFSDYKPWQDIAVDDWSRLNDAVKGSPGTPGQSRPGVTAAPATSAVSASKPPPSAPGRGERHMHMHGGQK
jgi:hypothetical protein